MLVGRPRIYILGEFAMLGDSLPANPADARLEFAKQTETRFNELLESMKFELAGTLEAVPGSKSLEGNEQGLLGSAQLGDSDPRYSSVPWQPVDPYVVQPDVDKRLGVQVDGLGATQGGGWSCAKVQRASDPKPSAREAFGLARPQGSENWWRRTRRCST
jgi:hypothetical protein